MPSTVRVGGVGRAELLQALRDHNVQLNQAAEALFEDHRFVPDSKEHVFEITLVSVAELGFGVGATYGQITARAMESGLSECPLELGPHLRILFLDQPEGAAEKSTAREGAPPGAITVASCPLDDRDETPKGFYLRRVDGVLWLRGYWSSSGHIWSPADVLVFARAS